MSSPASRRDKRPEAHRLAAEGNLEGLARLAEDKGFEEVINQTDSRGQNLFHVAADAGHLEILQHFMVNHPSRQKLAQVLNAQDRSGWSPLIAACAAGHLKIIEFLLMNQSCNAQLRASDEATPLHYLVRFFPPDSEPKKVTKYTNIANKIIQKGVAADGRNSRGESALHKAALAGRTSAIRWLLENKDFNIDVNSTTKSGDTALHLAASTGQVEAIKLLLQHGIDTTVAGKTNGTALDVAKMVRNPDIIALLENANTQQQALSQQRNLMAELQSAMTRSKSAASPGPSPVVRPGALRGTGSGIIVPSRSASPPSPSAITRSYSSSTNVVTIEDDDRPTGSPTMTAQSQDYGDAESRQIQRTRSETSLSEVGGAGPSSPATSSRSGTPNARNAVPVSHRMAKKNDVEGLVKDIEERGLWKVLGEMDRRGKSLMHVAVETGSMDVVQYLVVTYPDVSLNIKDKDGWTVMHAACASVGSSHKNLRMIEFLVETRRCDVKCRSRDGSTPLHYFVKNFYDGDNSKLYKKYCKMGALLLEKGCDLLDRNDKGETPLHSAALAGRVLAIKWLINKCNVDINITTKTGETSLHLATQAGRKAAIKELLRYGINSSMKGPNGTALDIAKLLKEKELIDILEEWEAHPELWSSSEDSGILELDAVSKRKHSRTMIKKRDTIIKEKQKKKDKDGKVLSKSTGEEEMTTKLKERSTLSKSTGEVLISNARQSSRTSKREMPEAHRLVKAGDSEGLLKLISEQGRGTVLTTLDWRGQSILHVAIDQNNFSLSQRIVELYPDQLEADLNLQDNNGWSPIHVAAASGNVDMLLYLLSSNRFDVTMLSSDGSTPLHYLIRSFPEPSPSSSQAADQESNACQKFFQAVRYLILKGVDIRTANKNGETVLHRASLSGKAAALRWLSREEQWTIDINATTNYGDSALHLAARVGAADAVRALLELGVDDSLTSQHGTALDVARRANHKEVVRILEEWGRQEPNARRPRRWTVSDVGSMVEGIFSAAYTQATKPHKAHLMADGEEGSSSNLSSPSVGSEASSLKSSQNGGSTPLSLNSSLANCPDHTALIESIVATLSQISANKTDEASSRRSSKGDLSNPPSLTSSASYVDSSATSVAVVDSILASIFDL